MKLQFILIIALHLSLLVKAQQNFYRNFTTPDNTKIQQLIGESYIDKNITHKGMFFRELFLPGKVVLNSMDSIDQIMLRYDCLDDQLIWLSKDNGQIKLDKLIIKTFEIRSSDTTFLFEQKKLNLKNDSTPQFYELCHKGKVQLYVQRKVIHSTDHIKLDLHYFLYKKSPQYYLVINNKPILIKQITIKNIYLLFPELKEKIHQRVKEANLRSKKETDFIKFIQTIDDILAEAN